MASAREKIPQLGLWDDEVPKVTHDKIVMWAYQNAEEIVRKYVEFMRPWDDLTHALSTTWTKRTVRIPEGKSLSDLPQLPEKPANIVRKRTLEKVIREMPEHGRSLPRILGYADLVVSWNPWYAQWDEEDNKWYVHNGHNTYQMLVEVKTTLPTIGELMRQINLYRLVYQHVVVVAPDASYADILSEQGVLFVQYDANGN